MAKSLYSLILSDEVVNRIDILAARQNTSRSALVNQILAEYCSLMTPEKRIESIFDYVSRIFGDEGDIIPFVTPNQPTMYLKSSLEYKYRPTVKYDIRLYPHDGSEIGELNVTFRTQSRELIDMIGKFFAIWKSIEDKYISQAYPIPITYSLSDGRFTRSIVLRENVEYTSESLAQSISDYVKILDKLLKETIGGQHTKQSLESAYAEYLRQGIGII